MKNNAKNLAINLRKSGLTYSEILRTVPVAKSTLSLWLKSVHLTKTQHQRLTAKKLAAIRRGGEARHKQRLLLLEKIDQKAARDVKELSRRHLWLAGIMLYWAEGSKEKENSIGLTTTFNNSDPRMIKLFIKWLIDIIKIKRENLRFSLYIHRTADIEKSRTFWSKTVACDKDKIPVYFKKPKSGTNRKNVNEDYRGLLRVAVGRSSVLNRKIAAWVKHICQYWGIV